MFAPKVSVLGAEYTITVKKYDEDEAFERCDIGGYCVGLTKSIVICDMSTYASAEVLVKHDYRNIKIGPNTTVSLDLEEVKKQLERDIYKALGGPCLEFGA